MTTHDVAIVGAGPIGIELAVALKRAGVDYVHFEAGQVGSTFQWWAPQTRFFSGPERISISGVPLTTVDQSKATREEYLAYLRGVVTQFGLEIRSYTRVASIERTGGTFEISVRPSLHGVGGPSELARVLGACEDRAVRVVRASRVVLAIGDMHLPHMLGVPGEDRPHVSHFFDDPHRYFQRRVLIVGGKNSAVEAALRCWRAGAQVVMSYRRDALDEKRVKYWLLPEIKWLCKSGRIDWRPRTTPVRIGPDSVTLSGPDGESEVACDFVLLLTGYRQDPTLLERLGVTLEGEGRAPAHDPKTMETDVPGVYVAGTAAAGTQLAGVRVFIENSHEHVDRITAHMTGRSVGADSSASFDSLPES